MTLVPKRLVRATPFGSAALACALVVIVSARILAVEPLESAIDLEKQANREAASSQSRIDDLADETEALTFYGASEKQPEVHSSNIP